MLYIVSCNSIRVVALPYLVFVINNKSNDWHKSITQFVHEIDYRFIKGAPQYQLTLHNKSEKADISPLNAFHTLSKSLRVTFQGQPILFPCILHKWTQRRSSLPELFGPENLLGEMYQLI